MNKVQLIGRVGNPFKRHGTSSIGEFTFATSSQEKDQQGNYQEVTEWHIVKVLGETNCQRAEKHFQKGKPLYLEGRLKTERWTNQTTGQEESRVKVYLQNWQFLPSDPHNKPAQSEPEPQ
ncbi:single-stranded DNA-binding protein [Kingella kingae]|uniref:single-stranded DNA-binding protein n=1 Tax=Kingella kingae TaxID=504 RepID=UPI00254BFEF8|nr:single-stranded DNA-binding protein [Kingella kingae]MDK4565319.1 single-stranded DNA-binding protein [Kingella kingae]